MAKTEEISALQSKISTLEIALAHNLTEAARLRDALQQKEVCMATAKSNANGLGGAVLRALRDVR